MESFRFVQASDAHLGYAQYNLAERREDFLRAFEEFTVKARELSPEFVVFAGDLFNSPHPSNPVLAKAIELIDDLKAPFLVVPGSHDNAYSTLVGTVLDPLHRGGHIHYLPTKPYATKNAYVYGMTNFRKRLDFTSEGGKYFEAHPPQPKGKYNIFALHQGVDFPELSLHPSQVEMLPEELPPGFQYYASGHLHTSAMLRLSDDSVFAYSGSLETFEYTEHQREKSFYLVEVGRDREATLEQIHLSEQRPFKVLQEDFTGLSPAEIEEKANKTVSDADEEGAIVVLVLEGVLPQGLTAADVNYSAIRSGAKALHVHLVNHLKSAEEEALAVTMTSAESLYSRARITLNEYYEALFGENAHSYADLTVELVNILSDKALKKPDRQRAAEKRINVFYGEEDDGQ